MRRAFILWCALSVMSAAAQEKPGTKDPVKPPKLSEKTERARKLEGFFPLYWDEQAGKMYLEIPKDRWEVEFLYTESLAAGIGSNDIGLDRGQLGDARVVKFQRIGPKVLLTEVNYGFRASSNNPAERRAVDEAFAQSVLWGFDVAAEEEGRALVDATSFFVSDAHQSGARLKAARQGNYKLEPSRSAVYLPNTRNFPDNTEVEATLTFTGEEPGDWVREVTPDPRAITVRQHHSLVRLPGPGYEPREFDPRAGYFGISYMDYSTPVADPIRKRYIARHRLHKKDPNAAISEPVKPIVYYLDPGTPEPIRSALLDGARWWDQAFAAAGYRNAFQVQMLPEDADPMDIRYNIIQWVHRSTRGWSYGGGVIDPRTGEIVKGKVTLGSLRVRQDYMIAEGLLAPYEEGRPADPRMLDMALARLRQLSAHEVGHTLGLNHNYIASTTGRASVMDYPHPLVRIAEDGSLDLSAAYASGIGEWDKVAIAYGYQHFPAGSRDKEALNAILAGAMQRGIYFLTDQDARSPGSPHPQTHLWDNGPDAIAELEHVLQVRARALERFSENNVRPGQPLALLEDVLVPIYLYHRYQTEAAVKVLGGIEYRYALRGDGQTPTTPVSPEAQQRALAAVLKTITPQVLAIPERLLRSIPPHPEGYDRSREVFRNHTGLTFDPLAAAESAAHHSVGLLLNAERTARLVEYHSRDRRQPSFPAVLDRLLEATWRAPRQAGYRGALQRVVEDVVLYHLMMLAGNEKASTQVRAMALMKIRDLKRWMDSAAAADPQQRAHLQYASLQISRFERDPAQVIKPTPPKEPPPGAPIGSWACDSFAW